MAKNKYHHLFKRKNTWHFRKGRVRMSLETTVATEAIRLRDNLLENYRLHGQLQVNFNTDEILTFGQVAKEWASIHQNTVAYSTWRDYRSAMNTHVLPAFKDIPIKDIHYLDVERLKAGLDCGAKRVNNILIPMRSVFKMAYKQDYIQDNVMLKVDNLSAELPDIFPFTSDEVPIILNAVDPFYRPYTATRFCTGMRSGEIDGLEWSDYKEKMKPYRKLHINKGFVYGREGKTKTKKSKRYIDCLEGVVEALEEQKRLTGNSKYIFLTKNGDRMNPDHYRNVVWKPALKKAGLEYRPPIQTRHTFATIALSEGEDIGWVQNMLGHSSLQMIFTRYYAWIPKKTRNDGSAFMEAVKVKSNINDPLKAEQKQGKIIELFDKNDTKTTHPTKRAHT